MINMIDERLEMVLHDLEDPRTMGFWDRRPVRRG